MKKYQLIGVNSENQKHVLRSSSSKETIEKIINKDCLTWDNSCKSGMYKTGEPCFLKENK